MSEAILTYAQRAAEAAMMQAIIQTAGSEAVKLQNRIKFLTEKGTMNFELEPLQNRLDATWDRHRQAQLRLKELERKQAVVAEIKVISSSKDRAQIVLLYLRDDGKKVSFTRHVHFDGKTWHGLSTVSNAKVTYELSRAQLAQTA